MISESLGRWLATGAAIVLGAIAGWLVRSIRARREADRAAAESDARFVDSLAESELVRREAAELRAIQNELATEASAHATTVAALRDQLAAQQLVAEQFRTRLEAVEAELGEAGRTAANQAAEAAARETERSVERDRLLARLAQAEEQAAKTAETNQVDRTILTTDLIDARRRLATATDTAGRLATERDGLERERQRLSAELARREAEVRVAVVAQQAAFAEFRSQLGALQAQADRAEVLRAQLEDRENLLRSLALERDAATGSVVAREQELAEARGSLARERSAGVRAKDAMATAATRIADLEAKLATAARERDALQAADLRSAREMATLREEIKERDVRFRALLEDRRAVVEAGMAEMARLRREINQLSRPREGPGGPLAEDDLKRITGIGPAIERLLHANGVTSLRQIAEWTEADIERISVCLGTFRDRIRRDRWVAQAQAALAGGRPATETTIG